MVPHLHTLSLLTTTLCFWRTASSPLTLKASCLVRLFRMPIFFLSSNTCEKDPSKYASKEPKGTVGGRSCNTSEGSSFSL